MLLRCMAKIYKYYKDNYTTAILVLIIQTALILATLKSYVTAWGTRLVHGYEIMLDVGKFLHVVQY